MSVSKLQRFKEMKTFYNVIEPQVDYKNPKDFEFKGIWKELFNNDNDIILELGCGRGEYSLYLAQKFPHKNFVAIDIKGARMWYGAKEAILRNINNIRFLRINIDFIQYAFGNDDISEIWLPHPDPQPKKPDKRLTSPRFLSYYQSFIKQTAIINLKTDNTNLFQYTLDVIKANNLKLVEIYEDIHSSNLALDNEIIAVSTYYEKMFLNQGEKIKFLRFILEKDKKLIEPQYRYVPNYKY